MFLGKAAKLDFALWELKRSHGIVTELKECHPNVFPDVLNGIVSFLELLILVDLNLAIYSEFCTL